MKDSTLLAEVAEPYAQALMSIAKDSNLTEQFGEDVGKLLEILESSDELTQFLGNPLVSPDAKKGALQQISSEQVSPLMQNFLFLLVDKNRIMFLADVLRQYQALLRELNQTVLAEVTSAVELSDQQKDAIRQKVTHMTGARQVDLSVEVNPDILGGLIIQVGSQIVDASLRGQIRRIGMQLSATA